MEEKKTVLVLGDQGVGKSSLIKLWIDGVAPETQKLSHTKIVIPRRTEHYELTDTPPLDSLDKIQLENLLKKAHLLVIVCDIQEPDTFLSFAKNFALIKQSGLPVIFLLNKRDLPPGNWEARKKFMMGCGIEKCAIVEITTSSYESLNGLKKKFEEFLPAIPFESEREKIIKQKNIDERKVEVARTDAILKERAAQHELEKLKKEKAEAARKRREEAAAEVEARKAEAQLTKARLGLEEVSQQNTASDNGAVEVMTRSDEGDATPLLSKFFQYTYNPSVKHSRQKRAKEINKSLTPENDNEYTIKQLIMLFAHYMSIRHVDSTLSRELENKLAKVLMTGPEYQTYKDTCENDRAGIFRGKKRDRVAILLREKLKNNVVNRQLQSMQPEGNALEAVAASIQRQRFSKTVENQMKILTDLLDCVDDLETGFFSYQSETGKAEIAGTMKLADKVYDHLLGKAYFSGSDVAELTRDLTLPSDALKVMQKAVPDPRINPLM